MEKEFDFELPKKKPIKYINFEDIMKQVKEDRENGKIIFDGCSGIDDKLSTYEVKYLDYIKKIDMDF